MPKTTHATGGTIDGSAQTQAQGPMLVGRHLVVRDGQIEWLPGDGSAADVLLVRTAAGTLTMTGGLSHTGASPAAAAAPPLWSVTWTDVPETDDINIAEFTYTSSNGTQRLAAWLNEVGRYRAEQTTDTLFDNLITLIASNAAGNGRLLRFERRDGSNVRQITGGVDQDGRLETSLYAWQSFSDFGENYSAATTNSFGGTPYPLAGKLVSDDTVRLRGGITVGESSTTGGDVMCVVPAALRPASPVILNATAAVAAGAVEVATNGELICRRSGTASASYLSMDGLTYTISAGV